MEAWTLRALTYLVSLLIWLPFCQSSLVPVSSTLCRRLTLEDAISVEENQCPLDGKHEFHAAVFAARGVIEVNGTDLEKSLQLLYTRESMYAAVLVYARWCPFSRALVPVFDSLASTFPSIYHFAVEESALQPSAYSYYGVHSFPVLLLHNKTVKVRYQGPRTYGAIASFYGEYSGFQPVLYRHRASADRSNNSLDRRPPGLLARALEKGTWQDDLYLVFSLIFLVLRVLFYILPRVMNTVKQHWDERFLFWKAYRSVSARGVFLGCFEAKPDTNTMRKAIKGKSPMTDFTQETGKVLLSVPGWPSSSLSPVSLAEGSSSKTGVKEDVRDNGQVYKNYLWG